MRHLLRKEGLLSSDSREVALPSLYNRVLNMGLVWLLIGAAAGTIASPATRELIAVISNAIAGMLLLPVLGLFLGIIGGRWSESLTGSIAGFGLGLVAALVAPGIVAAGILSMALIMGGVVGATLPLMLRLVRRLAMSPGR